jgi:hypothetical protein
MYRDIFKLSDNYLEHSLLFKKKASVALHLAICKHCRLYMKNLQVTVDLVKNSDDQTLDPKVIQDIMLRIEKR